jgi:hypothetical protein
MQLKISFTQQYYLEMKYNIGPQIFLTAATTKCTFCYWRSEFYFIFFFYFLLLASLKFTVTISDRDNHI